MILKYPRFASLILMIALSVGCFEANSYASVRSLKRFGLSVAYGGSPAPSMIGYQLNYNVGSLVRLSAGYGTLTGGVTQSVGVKFFVPGWSFSPFVGANYAKFTLNGSLAASASSQGVPTQRLYVFTQYGLDWQTRFGLNLGAGVSQIMVKGIQSIGFGYLGWFF